MNLLLLSLLVVCVTATGELEAIQTQSTKTYTCHTYRDPHVTNFHNYRFSDFHTGWSTMFHNSNVKVRIYQTSTKVYGKFSSIHRFIITDGKKKLEFDYTGCNTKYKGGLNKSKKYTASADKTVAISWTYSCPSGNSPLVNIKLTYRATPSALKATSGLCSYNKQDLNKYKLHRDDLESLNELIEAVDLPNLEKDAKANCKKSATGEHLGCLFDYVTEWKKLKELSHGSKDKDVWKKASKKCKAKSGQRKHDCMWRYIAPKVAYKKMKLEAANKKCHPLAWYYSEKAKEILKQSEDHEALSDRYEKKSHRNALKARELRAKARKTARKALQQLRNRQNDYNRFAKHVENQHKAAAKEHTKKEKKEKKKKKKPALKKSGLVDVDSIPVSTDAALDAVMLEVQSSKTTDYWNKHFGTTKCQYQYSNFQPLVKNRQVSNPFYLPHYSGQWGGYSKIQNLWHTFFQIEGFSVKAQLRSYWGGRGNPWCGAHYVMPTSLEITEDGKRYHVKIDQASGMLSVNGEKWNRQSVHNQEKIFPGLQHKIKGSWRGTDQYLFTSKATGVKFRFDVWKNYVSSYRWPLVNYMYFDVKEAKESIKASNGVFGFCGTRVPWEASNRELDLANTANKVMEKRGSALAATYCRKYFSSGEKLVNCVKQGSKAFALGPSKEIFKLCMTKTKKIVDFDCLKSVTTQFRTGEYQSQSLDKQECHDIGHRYWQKSQKLLAEAKVFDGLAAKELKESKNAQNRRRQALRNAAKMRRMAKKQAELAAEYFRKRAKNYGSMAKDLAKLHKIANK